MNKYINGKIMPMTEEDKTKIKARSSKIKKNNSQTSDYESRIKELEEALAALIAQTKTE